MRLSIENQLLTDSNNLREAEQVLTRWIEQHADKVIYAYQWEGDTYYEDWVSFLKQMADSNAEINLVIKPEVELKQEMRDSVLSYCQNLKEQLPTLVEKLFGTHPEAEENKLAALFEGLNYLISSASMFNFETTLEDRHEAVVELARAYEAKDFVEVADLLKYDWLPWVGEYEKKLQQYNVGLQ